ncbi:secernin-3-like [Babylonia areolata]|uniref:secernin-3-like n=1 Tax=Babylonia areolata TaxID=304850 RepID=UPI003FCFEFF9
MSDIFVALPPVTSGGCVLFAKNADRPPSEVQEVVYVPAADYPPGTKVKCTFLEIDQTPHTHAVVLSKAGWSWGSEMGANNQGVCGGCVSVWTRLCHPGDHVEKLLGCDLVRLALERSSTAREAVDTVTSLLAKHGQGGPCCEDPSFGQWTYHNSFLFTDRQHAWALETAGPQWVAKKITGGLYSMSSTLSIGTDYDLSSPGLKEAAAEGGGGAHGKSSSPGPVDFTKAFDAVFEGLSLSEKQQPSHRLQCGRALLQAKSKKGPLTVSELFDILRHTDTSSINMCGELLTVGSQVSVVQPPTSALPDVHWFTATPAPDLSTFKPFIFCPCPTLGKATLSPTLPTEGRVRQGSQTCADRRHLLYRMHEQGREVMESGGSQGKRLLETMRSLERQCVKDVAEFLDSFEPALMEEVQELFKDITESEVKFYK